MPDKELFERIGLRPVYMMKDNFWMLVRDDKAKAAIYGDTIILTDEEYKAFAVALREREQQPSIDRMVERFLCWKLPADFSPDCGINFDGRKDDEWNKNKTWPVGTNLLTAVQARQMFEYSLAEPSTNVGACCVCGEVTEWACADCRIDRRVTTWLCQKRECREKHEATDCTGTPVAMEPQPQPYDKPRGWKRRESQPESGK